MSQRMRVERLASVLRRHGFTVSVTTPETFRIATANSTVSDDHVVAARIEARMRCHRNFVSFVVIECDAESRCYEIRDGTVSAKCYRRYVHKFGIDPAEFFSS